MNDDGGWKERYNRDALELGVVRAFLDGMESAQRGRNQTTTMFHQTTTMFRLQAAIDSAQAALEHAYFNIPHQEAAVVRRIKKRGTP